MKSVEIKDGEELTDFTVEIDILSECQHPNIVKLLEAFFYQEKLYVSGHSAQPATSCPPCCTGQWCLCCALIVWSTH